MKRISLTYLLIAIFLGIILTASKFYGSWPTDYESKTAEAKLKYLWDNIQKDTKSTGAFPSIGGLIKLAGPTSLFGIKLPGEDFMVTGNYVSDQVPEGRTKLIHSVGKVAKVKFSWDQNVVKELKLTGLFLGHKTDAIARFSSGADPNLKNVPNMVFKFLINGKPAVNIFAGHGLGGQEEKSFFFNPLANHVPNRKFNLSVDGIQAGIVNKVFTKGPLLHGITGLSHLAQFKESGEEIKTPNAPFTIIFKPNPVMQKRCAGKKLEGSNYGCFRDLEVGLELYTIYAVMEPKSKKDTKQSDVRLIGKLTNTSKFYNSKFADEQIWFKHLYWPEEMEILKKGGDKAKYTRWNKVNENFMDDEGPEKYRNLLNPPKRRRLNVRYQAKH